MIPPKIAEMPRKLLLKIEICEMAEPVLVLAPGGNAAVKEEAKQMLYGRIIARSLDDKLWRWNKLRRPDASENVPALSLLLTDLVTMARQVIPGGM